MKILVTGNCGFIGQNFVRMFRKDHKIIGIDKMGYASDEKASNLCLTEVGDLCDNEFVQNVFLKHGPFDCVVHFAAESHVDNSIKSPRPFINSNIIGTFNILEAVRMGGSTKLVHISTDEVYGDLSLDDPPFSDKYNINPSSPYSASKAASDVIVMSYIRTFKINAVVTRSCNNYGPFQYKEKFLPVVIMNAMNDEKIPIYGNGLNVREWIHVKDNCHGVMAAVRFGIPGSIYNLGSGQEYSNIDLAKNILTMMKKPESLLEYVEDRKGHDVRYALDSSESYKGLGWRPEIDIEDGIEDAIVWNLNNMRYWN